MGASPSSATAYASRVTGHRPLRVMPVLRRGERLTGCSHSKDRPTRTRQTPEQRPIRRTTASELAASEFAEGSIGPKVRAACTLVGQTGGTATIGSITDIE